VNALQRKRLISKFTHSAHCNFRFTEPGRLIGRAEIKIGSITLTLSDEYADSLSEAHWT
jgi:hypothetical protein